MTKEKPAQIHISLTGDTARRLNSLAGIFGISRITVVHMAIKIFYDRRFPGREDEFGKVDPNWSDPLAHQLSAGVDPKS